MSKTEGIVIKEMKYKDSSKILTIFTREYGKITVMAKGALKPKSRLITNTELFFHNNYDLYRGRSFYYINDTDTINSFFSMRENLDRLMYGSYILELIDLSLVEEVKNEKIFELFLKGLKVLEKLEEDFLKFILAYEIKFISFMGYRPNLRSCGTCGQSSPNYRFSNAYGGLICPDCYYKDKLAKNISKEEAEFLRRLLFSTLDNLDPMDIGNEKILKLHGIMTDYILDKIERRTFNSLKVFNFIGK